MARTIGYSGILAIDYNKCQEVIDALTKAEEYAKNDRDCMINAQTYSEGCDGIGDAIPDAINNIKDKIDRIAKLKVSFSNYVEKVKTFDSNFASGFALNAFKNVLPQNQINLIINTPISTVELEKLIKEQEFCGMMEKSYKFNQEEAMLIFKAYDLSINSNDEKTDRDKLKDFLANISSLCESYNGHHKPWLCTDDAPTTEAAISYFSTIGMSADEVQRLRDAITRQHNIKDLDSENNTTLKDFAHEFVEIATYYNENINNTSYYNDNSGASNIVRPGRIIADLGTFGQTNEMASIKGDIWSGSMGNGDLYANIDSYNIYNRVKENKNKDFMNILIDYNESVINGTIDRGDEYCANYGQGDAEVGRKRIPDILNSWNPGVETLKKDNIKSDVKYGWELSSESEALNSALTYGSISGDMSQAEDILDSMQDTEKQRDADVSEINEAFTKFYNTVHIDIYDKEK